jgi:hypothetical protein
MVAVLGLVIGVAAVTEPDLAPQRWLSTLTVLAGLYGLNRGDQRPDRAAAHGNQNPTANRASSADRA